MEAKTVSVTLETHSTLTLLIIREDFFAFVRSEIFKSYIRYNPWLTVKFFFNILDQMPFACLHLTDSVKEIQSVSERSAQTLGESSTRQNNTESSYEHGSANACFSSYSPAKHSM
jgi:hypothetical protein